MVKKTIEPEGPVLWACLLFRRFPKKYMHTYREGAGSDVRIHRVENVYLQTDRFAKKQLHISTSLHYIVFGPFPLAEGPINSHFLKMLRGRNCRDLMQKRVRIP
jgi:hypothetical protein